MGTNYKVANKIQNLGDTHRELCRNCLGAPIFWVVNRLIVQSFNRLIEEPKNLPIQKKRINQRSPKDKRINQRSPKDKRINQRSPKDKRINPKRIRVPSNPQNQA